MPGKWGIRPEYREPLGAGADAAPLDVDDHILVAGAGQLQPC